MQYAQMETYGDRLIRIRSRRYETATDAARAMGMAPSTYMAHENGSRGGERNAERYARFFGVDLLWLLTGKGSPEGNPVQRLFDDLPPEAQPEALDFMEYLKNRSKKAG